MPDLEKFISETNNIAQNLELSYDYKSSLEKVFGKENVKFYSQTLDRISLGLKYIKSNYSSDLFSFFYNQIISKNKENFILL